MSKRELLLTPKETDCHAGTYGNYWDIDGLLKAQLAKDEARFAKERPIIEKQERERIIDMLNPTWLTCEVSYNLGRVGGEGLFVDYPKRFNKAMDEMGKLIAKAIEQVLKGE